MKYRFKRGLFAAQGRAVVQSKIVQNILSAEESITLAVLGVSRISYSTVTSIDGVAVVSSDRYATGKYLITLSKDVTPDTVFLTSTDVVGTSSRRFVSVDLADNYSGAIAKNQIRIFITVNSTAFTDTQFDLTILEAK